MHYTFYFFMGNTNSASSWLRRIRCTGGEKLVSSVDRSIVTSLACQALHARLPACLLVSCLFVRDLGSDDDSDATATAVFFQMLFFFFLFFFFLPLYTGPAGLARWHRRTRQGVVVRPPRRVAVEQPAKQPVERRRICNT